MTNNYVDLNQPTIDDFIVHEASKAGANISADDLSDQSALERFGRVAFEGKQVVIRLGIDCPVRDSGLKRIDRIIKIIPSLEELAGYGAKINVLAHQGREGQADFVSLAEHANTIRSTSGLPVQYQSDIGQGDEGDMEGVRQAVQNLSNGHVLVHNNVRFLGEAETMSGWRGWSPTDVSRLVPFYNTLAGLADVYVQEAFNVSHRNESSMMGFPGAPNIAGRDFQRELGHCTAVLSNIRHPYVLLFGGKKVDDYLGLIKVSLENPEVSHVLLTGIPAILGAIAEGGVIGPRTLALLDKQNLQPVIVELERLKAKHPGKLLSPLDFGIHEDSRRVDYDTSDLAEIENSLTNDAGFTAWDIGPKTMRWYAHIIEDANTVYNKGPAGKAEEELFETGTIEIAKATARARNKGAFTITSGGDLTTMVSTHRQRIATELQQEEITIDPTAIFSVVSLAGGAFINYLEGGKISAPFMLLNTHFNRLHGLDPHAGLPPGYAEAHGFDHTQYVTW